MVVATQTGIGLESLEYDRDSATYRARYDRETTSPSMAAVASLSEAMGVDPFTLDPLYASVDPEALDDLVSGRATTSGDVSVSFTVAAHEITVYSDGRLTIATPGPQRADDTDQHVRLE